MADGKVTKRQSHRLAGTTRSALFVSGFRLQFIFSQTGLQAPDCYHPSQSGLPRNAWNPSLLAVSGVKRRLDLPSPEAGPDSRPKPAS